MAGLGNRWPVAALAVLMTAAIATAAFGQAAAAAPAAAPADSHGMDMARLHLIDDLMAGVIRNGDCPGGVVLVGRGDEVIFRKTYGHRSLDPQKVEMTADTIFDMASVTKLVATATSLAVLVERGQISLRDRVKRFIPEFAAKGKDDITVEQLLTHRSGLIPDNPLKDYADGPAEAMKRVYDLPIHHPVGQFDYSDINYILLGEIVKRVSGMPLDEFAKHNIFDPAGMTSTCFKPPKDWWPRCAPQEKRDGQYIIGEVHDPRAYALGGVAGHAGLFSTVDDTARWCRMILRGGEIDGRRILSPATVREMTLPRGSDGDDAFRGLGFDIDSGYSGARGDLFPRGFSFGHTGFTGTSVWIDPTTGVYLIILTNRLHPDGKGDVLDLRRKMATVVASAVVGDMGPGMPPPRDVVLLPPTGPRARAAYGASGGPMGSRKTSAKNVNILTGLDVLIRDGFKPLAGRKVGLITNHTGLSRDGLFIVDLLAKAPGVKLVALFAPEHGFKGVLDEKIKDEKDATTGLTIYSLYGRTNAPTDEMLQGVDTLVFDIQDIGARFYTYESTMGNCMKAAAKHGIRYVVLDRPNPIRGLYVGGPLADPDKFSFTAFWRMPVAHGMTMGELATMWNAELKIGADLTVIKAEGWTRDLWYDETGLLWINPSPNMRNLNQALLYPGVCLIEACNLSVGRGTDQPFETFGAPWLDGRKLAPALNAAGLAGVRFVPIEFTPAKGHKLGDKKCGGVNILVTDREAIDPVLVGVTIAWQLRSLFGDAFEFAKVNNLLVNTVALNAIREAKSPAEVPKIWQTDLDGFRKLRAKYLLYR